MIADKQDVKTADPVKDIRVAEPPMYKVYLCNDDVTPMDFVVFILMEYFEKSFEEANDLMFYIHDHDKGLVGTYTKEMAEAKLVLVNNVVQRAGFPLKIIMEKE